MAEGMSVAMVSSAIRVSQTIQGRNRGWRGLLDTSVFEQLRYAARRMILESYVGMVLPQTPVSHITPTKFERNEEIRLRYQQGETLIRLAEVFDLSENRVWQIVHGHRS